MGDTTEHLLETQDWDWLFDMPGLTNFANDFDRGQTQGMGLSASHCADAATRQLSRAGDSSMQQFMDRAATQLEKRFRLYPPSTDATSVCIQQLSDLSTRLYPVNKVCRAIDAGQRNYKASIVTDAAFDALPELMEGPNGAEPPLVNKCNAVNEVFRASRYMINIVAELRKNEGSYSSTSHNTSETPENLTDSSSSPRSPLTSLWAEASAAETPESSEVVRYLLLGCYTRILQIYASLISSLHYDASCTKPCPDGFLAASMTSAELRLVLLLQLIQRLYTRLRVVVTSFLSQTHAIGGISPGASDHGSSQAEAKNRTTRLEVIVDDKLKALRSLLQC